MRRGWHRFWAWPDDQRARFLAKVLAGAIVLLLYLLGGISLYIRWRFFGPVENVGAGSTPVVISERAIEPSLPAAVVMETAFPAVPFAQPSPSLFPTITPGWYQAGPSAPTPVGDAEAVPTPDEATQVATETPFPTPTPLPPTDTPRPEATATMTDAPKPLPTATSGGLGPPPTRRGR